LDDAALSAGATLADLAAKDVKVTVLTVFAGLAAPPFSVAATRMHEIWGLPDDPVSVRRDEDERAIQLLGGEALHGDFPDAIYRRHPDGTWVIRDDGFPSRSEREDNLLLAIQRWIGDAISALRPDIVLTCAGVGDHVDHRLTRDAVLAAADGTSVDLRLWEDIPYSIWPGPRTYDGPLATREAIEVPDNRAWLAKYNAVASYVSQLHMLWPTSCFRADLERYGRSRAAGWQRAGGGEVFWVIPERYRQTAPPAASVLTVTGAEP